MSQLRLGLYGLALLASVLIVTSATGHSQTLPYWLPTNLSAVDRGMSPVPRTVNARPSARRRPLRPGDRRGRSGAAYQPGRVIVKFRNGVSSAGRVSALSQVSRTASMGSRAGGADFDVVNIDPSEDPEAAAAALAARSDVEYAQAAYRVFTYADRFIPNDPFYAQAPQWNFTNIDLERGWAIQPGGSSSIIVAVVDSGVAFTSGTLSRHAFSFCSLNEFLTACGTSGGTTYPALGDLSLPVARASDLATSDARFVSPYDFIWNTALPVDLDGHGTHVASTIGELTNNGFGFAGIAFNVKLMPVKVVDTDWDDIFHSPGLGTDDTVALGVRWAADHGANVINMSIGRSGPSAPAIESAIRYAVGKGAFVAIAGGNSFLDDNATEVIAEIASRVQGAVSVAALNRANGHASYSTTGSYLELAAPGGDGNDYVYQQTYDYTLTDTFNNPVATYKAPRFDILAGVGYQGTSMATPHVSGLAALLMSQGITDPAAVEAALEHFATPCSVAQNSCNSSIAPNQNASFGYGEINARNTLRGLGLSK